MSELETTRIIVRVEQGKASHAEFSFADRFSIGRDSGCDVQIMDDASVSRTHVEISFYDGSWRLRDAGSTNGTYVDGKKIDVFTLGASVKLRVGTGKTILSLIPQTGQTAAVEGESNSLTQYVQHYFGASNVEPAGQHTMMIRRAFELVQVKQKRKYAKVIALVSTLFLLAGAYAFYLHVHTAKQKERAQAIFYAMKSLEVDMMGIQRLVIESNSQQGVQVFNKYSGQRKEMENHYDQFLGAMGFYSPKLTDSERLILRVARIFGEDESMRCEDESALPRQRPSVALREVANDGRL